LNEARVEQGLGVLFVIKGDLNSFHVDSAIHGVELFLLRAVRLCKVFTIPTLKSPAIGFFAGT
jgi:hypothetical protein